MNQSFILHVENETTFHIPFEETMFLAAIKTNQLKNWCNEIFIVQVLFTNEMRSSSGSLKTVVKIQACNGEYTGYSIGNQWEENLSRGFDALVKQFMLMAEKPESSKQPVRTAGVTIENIFSEN